MSILPLETLVSNHETTLRHNPDDLDLIHHRRESLTSLYPQHVTRPTVNWRILLESLPSQVTWSTNGTIMLPSRQLSYNQPVHRPAAMTLGVLFLHRYTFMPLLKNVMQNSEFILVPQYHIIRTWK